MFKWLQRYLTKRRYKITVTERIGNVSITYTIEANTIPDLITCVDFVREAVINSAGDK